MKRKMKTGRESNRNEDKGVSERGRVNAWVGD